MTQTVVLAVGNTTAASSNITVGLTGVPVTVYIYSPNPMTRDIQCPVFLNGPAGALVPIGNLTSNSPAITLTSPGSYFVQRNVTQLDGSQVGVAVEQ